MQMTYVGGVIYYLVIQLFKYTIAGIQDGIPVDTNDSRVLENCILLTF